MAGNEELKPLFLLDDEPIAGHAGDFLNRKDDARMIAGAVLGTTGPFSVGIYGEWGTGKTSLLLHIKSLLEVRDDANPKHLRYPYLVTVFFNAWQHEKDPEPLAHLAEAVDAGVTKRLDEVATITDKVLEEPVAWLRSAHLAARSLIYGVSLESRFDPTDELVKARRWQFWKWVPFFRLSYKDVIDRYEKLRKDAEDPKSKAWNDHVKQSVSRSVLRSFRANQALLDKVRPGEEKRIPRVVIFIDDMDRCLAEDAFKLLQSIKLAIAQPGFIFVMTLDPAALQPYLETKVGTAGQSASANSKTIYLDKLLQLPYPLRLHDDQFAGFVDKIINVRLKEMLVAPDGKTLDDDARLLALQWKIFRDLARVLELSSQKNPRTLVRRINGLLVGARVASPDIKSSLDEDRARAESVFMGLCLVLETLKHFVKSEFVAALVAAQPLCTAIRALGLSEAVNRSGILKGAREIAGTSAISGPLASENQAIDAAIEAGKELLRELHRVRCLDGLFKSEAGKRWLSSRADRELVETFYAKRPEVTAQGTKTPDEPPAGMPTKREPPPDTPGDAMVPPTPTQPSGPQPGGRMVLAAQERGIIERTIRGALDLPADASLGPAELGHVRMLTLNNDPITDAGAAWLTDPATGLNGLTWLGLNDTQVTDAGVKELARADTGLKALNWLTLASTQVTDAGVKELARADTGLKALTSLELWGTQVTDAGVKELARADTGLKALTDLGLRGTEVTDAGVKELARTNTGLKALTKLNLEYTKVTDAGIEAVRGRWPTIRIIR